MMATTAIAAATAGALTTMALPASSAPTARTSPESAAVSVVSPAQQVKKAPGSIVSKVRGEFGRRGKVRGTFEPDRFFVKRGETYANGVLHARLIRGNGTVIGSVDRRVNLPVKRGMAAAAAPGQALATCDVLNLVLGPLDLNLLGLEVHLKRVVLDVIARTGAGNLLGNLLCAVAGLLDNTGLLSQLRVSNLLNRILGILRV